MSKHINGTREHWRAAMLRLPDDFFFDLMRTHLGPLHTPYNKHSLLDGLENYLRRPAVRARILCAVTPGERRILTAVNCYPDTSHTGLHRVLGDELGFVRLHHILLNLEDRVLLYRDPEAKTYSITPLVAEYLQGLINDIEILFPPDGVHKEPAHAAIWSHDLMLLTLFVYLRSDGKLLKNDGRLRKASQRSLSAALATLARDAGFPEKLSMLVRGLGRAGLLRRAADTHVPLYSRFRALAALSAKARACLPAIASALADPEMQQEQVLELAERCAETLGELRSQDLYTPARLLGLLSLRLTSPYLNIGSLHENLVILGLVCTHDKGHQYLNPDFFSLGSVEGGTVVIQSTFELQMQPELPFADALTIVTACDLVGLDTTLQLEISRQALGFALVDGIGVEELIQTLALRSTHSVPQNVAYSLRSWAQEYMNTGIDEGVVLSVDEDRRDLVEHDPRMRPFIRRTLAPGVYLLPKATEKDWRQVLADCGILLLPARQEASDRPHADSSGGHTRDTDTLRAGSNGRGTQAAQASEVPDPLYRPETESADKATANKDYNELRAALLAELERKQLSAEVSATLRERIENRVILHKEQIQPGALRSEQTEAKGLDYSGKVRLIEQALSSERELLELIERVGAERPIRRLLKPMALKRNGTRLLLHGVQLPAETELRVDISKIGLLRRVRGLAGDRL